ncbi:hypothetical protein CGLO_10742 [Colletotrichum gloeosporioides Cg-14]|uniref:Uncharacterized protein n=1 Tax=Colletotrichum gloeosporioides (strain Cg-14) TaxID=1237896 RepID=T0K2M8_COLGC|nr:hypothetical protein CGLO_10742 [Colletotrichum gloeosporioides Cg-14]
MQQKPFSFL